MKQLTITHYVCGLLMILIVLFSFLAIVFVHIFSDTIVRQEIEMQLNHKTKNECRYIELNGNKLNISNQFQYKDENYHFVVMSRTRGLLSGSYPQGFPSDYSKQKGRKVQQVEVSGMRFFVCDRSGPYLFDTDIYVRGIANYSDVSKQYGKLKYFAYGCIALGALVIIGIGGLWARKLSRDLKSMCQTAEKIGAGRDVTQRISYEGGIKEMSVLAQANNRMLDRIEQMLSSQEQFASNIAHELRTPVAVIMAESQYGSEKADSVAGMRQSFDLINRQSEKMRQMIMQVLYLSRLEQGRQSMEKEMANMVDVVEVVCEDEKERMGKQIDFRFGLKDAWAMMDLNLVVIGVRNLISNAVKFSPPGGEIFIETGEADGKVHMSVTDQGLGISEEHLDKIFTRFYKADSSRGTEGIGLGMSLAMKIAKLHGGTIEVESKVGEGSTFRLWLAKE